MWIKIKNRLINTNQVIDFSVEKFSNYYQVVAIIPCTGGVGGDLGYEWIVIYKGSKEECEKIFNQLTHALSALEVKV